MWPDQDGTEVPTPPHLPGVPMLEGKSTSRCLSCLSLEREGQEGAGSPGQSQPLP